MGWMQGTTRTAGSCPAAALILLVAMVPGARGADTPDKSVSAKARVVVSIPDRKLAVVAEGQVQRVFEVSVGGAKSPTPSGTFQITSQVANPTYYHPGVVIPAGRGNPLGPRWIGLSKKGYGIHGTNVPSSIGKAASHGCVRLRNRDIVRLYSMVSVGDIVEIHGDHDDETARLFDPPNDFDRQGTAVAPAGATAVGQ